MPRLIPVPESAMNFRDKFGCQIKVMSGLVGWVGGVRTVCRGRVCITLEAYA